MQMGSGEMSYSQWICFALIAGTVFAIVIVREKQRERVIRRIAQAQGFVFPGGTLLKRFPFSKTSVARASSIRNAITGELGSTTFLVFDCRFGAGKHSYSQTIVAVKGSSECLGFQRFDTTLVEEQVEDWTFFFRRKDLLLPEEIQTLLPTI